MKIQNSGLSAILVLLLPVISFAESHSGGNFEGGLVARRDFHSGTTNLGAQAKGGFIVNYDNVIRQDFQFSIGGTNDLHGHGSPIGGFGETLDISLPKNFGIRAQLDLRADPQVVRTNVYTLGVTYGNDDARIGLAVIPFGTDGQLKTNLDGFHSGLRASGSVNATKSLSFTGTLDANLTYNKQREEELKTVTDSNGISQKELVTAAIHQVGYGDYVSASASSKLKLGQHAYLKLEAVYDHEDYKTVQAGAQENRTFDALSGTFSAGGAF